MSILKKNISFITKIRIILILLILFLIISIYSIRKIAFTHIYNRLHRKELDYFSMIIEKEFDSQARFISKLNNSDFINFVLRLYKNNAKRGRSLSNENYFLKDLNIDLIFFKDINGNFQWGRCTDIVNNKELFITKKIQKDLIYYLNNIKIPSNGIIFVNDDYYIVNIKKHMIDISGRAFPAVVVIGSLLSKEFNYISKNYECNINYLLLNGKRNNKANSISNNKYFPDEESPDALKRMQFNDILNNPVFELLISTNNFKKNNFKKVSGLSVNGIINIAFYILVLIVIGLVTLIFIVFEKIGIDRIRRLNKQLYSITSNLDLKNVSVIEEKSNDEIGKLQRNINRLLNDSKMVKDILRKEKYNFKNLLEGKTKELIAVNNLLYKKLEEHRKMENILRESEEKYRKVVNNAHEAILIIQDGIIIFANRRFFRMMQIERDAVIDKNFINFVYEDDRELVEKLYNDRIKGRVSNQSVMVRLIDSKMKIYWTKIFSVLIKLQGIDSLIVFIDDITENKKIEEDRENLQKQLLQAQKMEAIGRLASGIAHDFNNMLTPIIGYAELIISDDQLSNTYKNYISEIKEAAERASSLTKQLLLFSKKQAQEFSILDINKIIKDMKKLFISLLKENIGLKFDLEPKLKKVKADKGKIEQVLMNLVINAGDAINNSGAIVIKTYNIFKNNNEIISNNNLNGNLVAISVRDDGIGMDEKTKERIFEPFFTTKGSEKGTGLGLSVVYGIIQQHNGWIDLESKPGSGSNFTIYLPAVVNSIENNEKSVINIGSNWRSIRGRHKKVLLVEDDENILNFTYEALTMQEFKVITATSYKEALKVVEIEGSDIDLLFTDIILPGGSGLDLVMEIKNRYPNIKVLLTSGYTPENYRLNKIKQYGYKILSKPYSITDMLQHITNQFENQ